MVKRSVELQLGAALCVLVASLLQQQPLVAGQSLKSTPVSLPSYRLPTNVAPEHYTLFLNCLNEVNPSGWVKIKVLVGGELDRKQQPPVGEADNKQFLSKLGGLFSKNKQPVPAAQTNKDEAELPAKKDKGNFAPNRIVLHKDKSVRLNSFSYTKFSSPDAKGQLVGVESIQVDEEKQLLAINLVEDLVEGEWGELQFEFYTDMRSDLRGLYLNSYALGGPEMGDTTTSFIATNFQPSDARLVFPCFDEPKFKAQFELTLLHKPGTEALSNAPVKASRVSEFGKTARTEFQPTPRMSVHMVAFTVGEFEHLSMAQVGERGVGVRVFTPKGLIEGAGLVLRVAAQSIEWMERDLGRPFPLDKLDVVLALDHDKDNTESWGLAFVRCNVSLVDRETRPETRIGASVNVAHVVAHQWFANLVTPAWWDSLWVTEGVAALKAFEIVADLDNSYQSDYFVQFATLSGALKADAHVVYGAHALAGEQQVVQTSGGAYSLFDTLEFAKSGSLFKLLERDLGREALNLVLRDLLKWNSFATVDKQTLGQSIERVAKKGPNYLNNFATQINQVSWPMLNVELEQQRGEPVRLRLHKAKVGAAKLGVSMYFSDGGRRSHECPLDSVPSVVPTPKWFDWANPKHFIKINSEPDVAAFFRVHYFRELEPHFREAIGAKLMQPVDRADLVDNALGLYEAGEITGESLERWLGFYENEEEEAVLLQLVRAVDSLRAHKHPFGATLATMSQVFERFFQRHGFQPPSGLFVDLAAQRSVLTFLVQSGHAQVVEGALQKFHHDQGLVPEVHLREPIYLAVVGHGKRQQVDQLLLHLETTGSLEERLRLIRVLAGSKDQAVRERLVQLVGSPSILLPQQMRASLLASLAQ